MSYYYIRWKMKRTKKNKLIDTTTLEQEKENAIKRIAFFYQLEKHRKFRALKVKHFVSLAMLRKSNAIRLLPDKESLIGSLWKGCVMEFLEKHLHLIQEGILYTLGCPQKNSWATFHGKLSSCDPTNPSILHTLLFKTLLRELTLKGKGCNPFWTHAYKGLSEKLLLHTKTDYVDSDMNLSSISSKKVEEKSLLSQKNLPPTKKNQQNKNSQKIFFPSSISTHVDKWVNENTKQDKQKTKPNPNKMKTIKIRLILTKTQKKVIKEWFDTSNYVYNHANEYIKSENINMRIPCAKLFLRDKLIYARTRKSINDIQFSFIEKNKDNNKSNDGKLKENPNVQPWELNTPSDIRASAVYDVYEAYHTAYSNIKAGNIRKFEVKFRKKNDSRSITIPHRSINIIKNGIIRLFPRCFSKNDNGIRMGKRTKKKYGNISINHDCRMICDSKGNYWLNVPTSYNDEKPIKSSLKGTCGIDPGVRTFLSIYGTNGESEIQSEYHTKIIKLNERIDFLKYMKKINRRTGRRVRIRKRRLTSLEQRKSNIINEMHWSSINKLLKTHDVIFLEDTKSHDIVKDNKNRKVNRSMMDMRFYTFKQRFAFKATICF